MEIANLKQIFKKEIKTNRRLKKENKNIIDVFLSNIKKPKRELPKIPVVPALLDKLPDSINNMMFFIMLVIKVSCQQ